ncbi:hypothetical protein EOL70_15025 [Leucothrix sargassi]|nr:hypothetical protein EOL70_15025 [Leucothrix sargassi]
MMRLASGLALLLALCVCVANSAYAHGLPGSTLTFSQQGDRLALSVSFALEDLIIAEPTFEALASKDDKAPSKALSATEKAQLSSYFKQHLSLQHAAKALPLTLVDASLKSQYHHDLGTYTVIESRFSAPLTQGTTALPLSLRYDAVMHEVRSHRAFVYWSTPEQAAIPMTNFVYRTVDGKPRVYVLDR